MDNYGIFIILIQKFKKDFFFETIKVSHYMEQFKNIFVQKTHTHTHTQKKKTPI